MKASARRYHTTADMVRVNGQRVDNTMARKTSTAPTRIWSYHALAPTQGADAVREILFRQSRYYNKLIEIERSRIEDYQQTRRFYAPELEALEASEKEAAVAVDGALDAIKAWRAQQFRTTGGKTKSAPVELKTQLTTRKEELKVTRLRSRDCRRAFEALLISAREEFARRKKERGDGVGPRSKSVVNADVLREMLTEDWPEAWRELAQCDDAAHARAIKARAECGLPPGCYLLVEQAAQKAIQDARPAPPRFHRFDGGGRIGVQLTEPTTVAQLIAGSKFRLRVVEAKRSGQYGVASIRIGSNPDRSPVWAEFPMRLHRSLPSDGVVKWAWVKVTREGQRVRYELQITLEALSFAEPRFAPGTGKVAVNFGWCKRPDGIRVAYWVSDMGEEGEVSVPSALIDRLTRSESLRSFADVHRDTAYRVLSRATKLAGNRLTHWARCTNDRRREQIKRLAREFAEQTLGDRRLPLWETWKLERAGKRQDFFVGLPEASRWLRVASPGRSSAVRLAWWLELWTRKDSHLRTMEHNVRSGSRNARDEAFREAAIALAKRFDTVVIDDCSIAEMARVPAPNDPDGQSEIARSQRAVVAPGFFRETLCAVVGKARVTVVDSKHNTENCNECGQKLEIENRSGRCACCGLVIDIDRNNCRNLLRRERSGGDENPGGARNAEITLLNDRDGLESAHAETSAAE